MDAFHSQCVFSSIDSGARYAWGNQSAIGHWNLTRFAETLLPLLSEDSSKATKIAEVALSGYSERFGDQYIARFRAKFALPREAPVELIKECLELLGTQAVDFTLFFRQLTRVAAGEDSQALTAMFCSSEPFKKWFAKWRREADPVKHLADMRAANPILIPRNHRVEQAIQSAYAGDFTSFHRLVDALAAPFADQVEYADLETPPRPEEIVRETFCGT
jgi:uncharacterized protein YdiU (UPF0061 family)